MKKEVYEERSINSLHSTIRSHLLWSWMLFIISLILAFVIFFWLNLKQMDDALNTWKSFFDKRIKFSENIIGVRGRNSSPLSISDYRVDVLENVLKSLGDAGAAKINTELLNRRLNSLRNDEIYIVQFTDQSDGSRHVYYIKKFGSLYNFISFKPEDYLPEITLRNWIIRLEYDGNILYSTAPNEAGTKNIPAIFDFNRWRFSLTFNTRLNEAPATRLYLTHDISTEFYVIIIIIIIISIIFNWQFMKNRGIRRDLLLLQNEQKNLRELMFELAKFETDAGINVSSDLYRLKDIFGVFLKKLETTGIRFYESRLSMEIIRNYITNMQIFIGEIIKNNEALRESEERYRIMINAIPDNVWEISPDGVILFCSGQIMQTLGYTPAEVTGRRFFDYIKDDEAVKAVERYAGIVGRNELIRNFNAGFKHRSGDAVMLESNGYPFFGSDGRLAGYRLVSRDISERLRHEEEKVVMEKQLVQAQKMEAVGTLAGGIAHDFNNLLAGVLGSLEILSLHIEKSSEPDVQYIRRFVDLAFQSSKKAVNLVRQLLNISRRQRIVLQAINLKDSIQSVVSLCANSFPKSVIIKSSVPSGSMFVMADPVQVEQVLLNLCINASHAMTFMRSPDEAEGGDLTISAESILADDAFARIYQGALPGATYHRITITDTGVGMSAETIQHIFEPFYTTKESDVGTGLGLFMVYNVTREMGGFINVVSLPGSGTTFHIFFPEYIRIPDESDNGPGFVTKGSGNVLIIDDERSILLVEENILREMGFSIIAAHGPDEGIDKFTRNSDIIDAVILDVSMPGKSGIDLCRIFRSINPDIGILFTSGFVEDSRIQKAQRSGIDGFIMKPFDTNELGKKLNDIIMMKMQMKKTALLEKGSVKK